MLPFHDISAHDHIQLAMTPNTVSRAGLDIAGSLETAVSAYLSGKCAGGWRSLPTAKPLS